MIYGAIALIAYGLGNFSSGYILGRVIAKQDIRSLGSGNVGSTNALRSFGPKVGALTFLLDILKGVLAVWIGSKLDSALGIYIASVFVIIGHSWPVVLGFKGGKGIATSAGVLAYLDYRLLIVLLTVFALSFLLTKIVSVGSITASASAPIATFLLHRGNTAMIATIAILAGITLYRHRSNMGRLLRGEGKKIIGGK